MIATDYLQEGGRESNKKAVSLGAFLYHTLNIKAAVFIHDGNPKNWPSYHS